MRLFSRTDTSIFGQWWWTVDRWLFMSLCLLIALGFFLTMAASPAVAMHLKLDAFYFVKRHAIYGLGVLFFIITFSMLNSHQIRRVSLVLYLGVLALLILTPIIGVEIKGAKRWIGAGFFSLQPSEFMKPLLAILVAWMLSEKARDHSYPGYTAALLFYAMVIGPLLLQPDMGMIILISLVTFAQFFLAGLPLLWIGVGLLTGVGGLVGAYFSFSHVRARIDRFFDPTLGDKYADRYQVNQSLEAFSSGGLMGRGPGEGMVKNHLPDAHADFIFAVAGEEFGFFLCLFIVMLFAFVVVRSSLNLFKEESMFRLLAVAGLTVQFGGQALINLASTLDLIPTKGMTLPLISYGGSSMVALSLTLGMILSLTRKRVG